MAANASGIILSATMTKGGVTGIERGLELGLKISGLRVGAHDGSDSELLEESGENVRAYKAARICSENMGGRYTLGYFVKT